MDIILFQFLEIAVNDIVSLRIEPFYVRLFIRFSGPHHRQADFNDCPYNQN